MRFMKKYEVSKNHKDENRGHEFLYGPMSIFIQRKKFKSQVPSH